ncbi:N-acetylmuramidase domain-containing protein [Jiella sp. M17.18]|uniref:N-acetylmuramidase domain-containing protein n=1 Tax=Jiella sp. M17.18 TaxID=3234247 RepID=UPI0034DFAF81
MQVQGDVLEAARRVGAAETVDPAALVAVAIVETRAVPLAFFDRRAEPLIRFEGHYFDRLLKKADRARARAAGLASPKAGGVRNPASQAGRWQLFDRAAAIDAEAAAGSVSWGLCQVMGSNWKSLGFESAAALAACARGSIGGQMTVGARFLAAGKLAARLAAGDFAGFARRYNGPAYAQNRYDTKIRTAYHQAVSMLSRGGGGSDPAPLAMGATGEAVRQLQAALARWGQQIAVDGVFGPATEAALAPFRRGGRGPLVERLQTALAAHGHAVALDGIFGARTEAALGAFQASQALPPTGACDAATLLALL